MYFEKLEGWEKALCYCFRVISRKCSLGGSFVCIWAQSGLSVNPLTYYKKTNKNLLTLSSFIVYNNSRWCQNQQHGFRGVAQLVE